MAVATLLASLAAGCGGGTTTVERTVTTPSRASVQSLVIARLSSKRREPEAGEHTLGATKCAEEPGAGVQTIHVYSDLSTCVRVSPQARLLFVNSTGRGPKHREPEPVEITVGAYEASIDIGQSALFPAPVGSYLRLGLHEAGTSTTAQQPSVLVLPEGCAIKNPEPGEGLCFAAGAPRCPGPELETRVGRGGAAAGTDYQHFEVVNRSRHTCTVSGYPRLLALDAQGRPIGLPGTPEHLLSTMSGNHPKLIALEPAGVATFVMSYVAAANFSPPCGERRSAALRVTLPPAGPSQRLPYRMELCPRQSFNVGRIE
jgi:hypothetical protein